MNFENTIRVVANIVSITTYVLAFGTLFKTIYLMKMFTSEGAGRYIAEDYINYFISSLLMIQTSVYLYYEISEKMGLEGGLQVLLTSGFFLTLILICTGKITDFFHIYVRSKDYKKLRKDFPKKFREMNPDEKTYIICWSCLSAIIISMLFDLMISMYAIAIFLGRFFWYDSYIEKEDYTIKDYFTSVFFPMNDKNKKINGSIITIKNYVLIGSIIYVKSLLAYGW